MKALTEEQRAVVAELDDEQLEHECDSRGIWPDECEECEDCPDCDCEDFRPECEAIFAAFYTGREADAIERMKKLLTAVTGRYL